MKFTVLGPLTLHDGGPLVIPSAPKTRSLLALLVLNADTPVSQDMCMGELWPDDMPPSAVQSLHTRILHLRQALAVAPSVGSLEAAKQVLVTHSRGYMLRLHEGALDLHDLRFRLRAVRQAELARDDRKLSFALREALKPWRGSVLGDTLAGPWLQPHVTSLEEQRITLLEKRMAAELRLGLHHELLPELRNLTAHHEMHESLHAQYMLALYRSGRAAEALTVYRELRDKLVEQVGIEPSERLRTLHGAILAQSPDLALRGPEGVDGLLPMLSAG
ncbi:AfsR/SARP family transcriptional regulator [Streptomyces xiaopingdaonensis]|uniref:AfsR/SARP family transcriptional regulator n=1 Tax=Streptomyces xiaopingdaonensis TaxID=1565415 RepID=UPI000308EF97|nr:AfsR/SARP family transcriptional regulator [Streptomyces xiaopingdaonensis]